MSTTQQPEQRRDLEQHKRDTLRAFIEEQVIHSLGRPAGLFQVQVRPLWQNYYRVNVLIGADAVSSLIANSYFVETDGEGKIAAATPKIAKQY